VDVASLEAQIRYELHGGVHGLLVLGTIGEGQYVSDCERAEVIVTAVRVACGVPVVVGIHTCNLEVARQQMSQAKELGAAAVLVKYVGKPKATPGEVLSFYLTLSDCRLLPILYYHYPSQTGLKLSAQDIGHILALNGIIGIKESTLNLREVQAHIQLMHGQGKVFLSGTALNLTQFLGLGGSGAMCPEAVLLPGPTVEAYTAWTQADCDVARAIQSELFEMSPILRDRPTPAGVTRIMLMSAEDHKMPAPMGHDQPQARLKEALNCMVTPTPTLVKCPLPQLTGHELKRVQSTVHKLQDIDWAACTMPVPPVPLHTCPSSEDQGMLLRTGAFQLGSGVGKDLLRSQGDGEGR
jgi:dihydrodipicolinate synthase/N-acetylneuraminate lyase